MARFYFGGGPQTVWARNLARSPQIVVHLESGDEVVILEGTAERHTEDNTSAALLTRIDDAYEPSTICGMGRRSGASSRASASPGRVSPRYDALGVRERGALTVSTH